MEANIKKASSLIKRAVGEGAKFVLTPENVSFMAANAEDLHKNAYEAKNHPALKAFSTLAEELDIWLLVGSVSVHAKGEDGKLNNRSYLFDNKGEEIEHYDKIHLYDVDVPGGETHSESKNFSYGTFLKLVDMPAGKLGMTVCYDLRFPHLFRELAKRGAELISVPSAFTRFTGQAHWETLIRARAIENGCYILAPAQTGSHPANRKTYGHSMIVDPWGEILAQAGEEECFIMAEIDKSKVHDTRKALSSLQHDKEFAD